MERREPCSGDRAKPTGAEPKTAGRWANKDEREKIKGGEAQSNGGKSD